MNKENDFAKNNCYWSEITDYSENLSKDKIINVKNSHITKNKIFQKAEMENKINNNNIHFKKEYLIFFERKCSTKKDRNVFGGN
jgi:hypothetical protein